MRFTLQIKLALGTALVVILSFLVLAHLTIKSQKEFFDSTFRDLAANIGKTLDATIANRKELEDTAKLQSIILKIVYSMNPPVVSIGINLPVGETLKTVASNDSILLDKKPSPENFYSYRDGRIRTSKIKGLDKTELLSVITPIQVGGQRVGTYEVRLSLQKLEETISKVQRQFLIMTIISIAVIIFFLSLLMRLTVVNPVRELQLGMKKIGAGDLGFRIKARGKDEFGDLALGFNQMTNMLQENYHKLKETQRSLEKKVQERTQKLEEAKSVLEIKVRARTRDLRDLATTLEERVRERTKEFQESQKELQKKVEELERFHKLAVGRELKMLELKKKIKELEKAIGTKTKSSSKK